MEAIIPFVFPLIMAVIVIGPGVREYLFARADQIRRGK